MQRVLRQLLCMAIVGCPGVLAAQPYVGASFSCLGTSAPGIGAAAGLQIWTAYLGFEYGEYGHAAPATFPVVRSAEVYYGLDLGIVVYRNIRLGAAMVFSHQELDDGLHHWFSIGPAAGYLAWNHALLNCAYTMRRGLNIGAAFLFSKLKSP